MAGEPTVIICARDTAALTVTGSDFTHNCGKCGHRVMIAPTGIGILEERPTLEIICSRCFMLTVGNLNGVAGCDIRLTASPQEIREEIGAAVPNLHTRRN